MWKGLSQGIHMWNMKVLPLVVHKLWPRLKFLSTDDDNNDDNDNNAGGYDNSSPDFRHGELKTQWIGITCMQLTSPQVPPSKTIHDQLRPIPRSSYRAIIYALLSKRAPITVILADSVCLYRSFDERSRERRETKVDKASSGFVDILRWRSESAVIGSRLLEKA